MRIDYGNAIEEKDIAKIWINGEEFHGIGYQGLMTVNTKTYIDEPTRSNDGSIPNINDHATFIVPRCKVNFKYFNISDYQRLCRVLNSANQFPVTYFDKQFGQMRTYMMYAEPEEMAKIYNVGTLVIGLFDYEVSFIGTLNDLEEYNVSYDTTGLTARTINAYSSSTTYYENDVVSVTENEITTYYKYINKTLSMGTPVTNIEYWQQIGNDINERTTVAWGNSIKILTGEDLTNFYIMPSGRTFKGWNTRSDGTGYTLAPNSNWTVFENITIYPIFE